MLEKFDKKAAQLQEETPEDRNRYADFLRVMSILLVVFGHWLVAFIAIENGVVRAERLLAIVPVTQWLTWLFQVMPVFFFVGGLANAISWDSAQERGESYADWIRRRARRLLWPLVPFFLTWIPLAIALDMLGVDTELVILASHISLLPLWFLAAYMCVVTIAPAAYWLHRRLGPWALVIFIGLAIIVDILFEAGIEWVGWSNFLWVWGGIHQIGFFWHDDRMPRKSLTALLLAMASFGILLFLVYTEVYPLAMVGTGEIDIRTNDSPPSVALFLLAIGQIGLIFALKKPAERLLNRARIWAGVLLLGSRMMSVYIWHMTAMTLIGLALIPTGLFPAPLRVDSTWWLLRIPWVAILVIALAVLVALFGRFERPREATPTEGPQRLKGLLVFFSVALTVLGLALIVDQGLYAGDGLHGLPYLPLGLFVVGLIGLNVIGPWIFKRDKSED